MNRLDLILERPQNLGWRTQTNPLPPSKKTPDHMTQIVGIICKDSIVVASESQYTVGTSKLLDAKKISVIKFKRGSAIIAECGVDTFSSKAVRYINESAKDKEIEDEYTVSKIAEDAVKKIRHEILSAMQERDYSASEQNEIFSSDDNRFGLMIAHYFTATKTPDTSRQPKPIPRLYTISLFNPQAQPHHPFSVLGAAERLATYILRQFKCEELLFGEAFSLAIVAVNRINDDDIYCGGQIKLAFLNPAFPVAAMFEDEFVNRALEKLRTVRNNNDARYRTELEAVMKQIDQEDFEKFVAKLEAKRISGEVTGEQVYVKPPAGKFMPVGEKIP